MLSESRPPGPKMKTKLLPESGAGSLRHLPSWIFAHRTNKPRADRYLLGVADARTAADTPTPPPRPHKRNTQERSRHGNAARPPHSSI